MKTIGIILSGGKGERFKSSVPKQYMSLNGKLVIQYVIDAFEESNLFDQIVIALDLKYVKMLKYSDKIKFAPAGETRTGSVFNALKACPKDTKYVLFHDAARPFINKNDLAQYLNALNKCQAAITSVKITDALFHAPRDQYKLIQTPEAFHFKKLLNAVKKNNNYTAIYENVMSCKIKFIELDYPNTKITYAKDLFLAEQMMKYQDITKRVSEVKNKNILILGGTGGIGSALTKRLIKEEANVLSLGSRECDLSDLSIYLPNRFPKMIYDRKWDCIVHSAGAYATDSDGLLKNYDKIFNINFKSIVALIEEAKYLINPGGSIICIGSTAASKGRTGISLYSASKAALNCFVEAVYPTLEKQNIRINVICPAKVNTQLQTCINPKADKKDMISPDSLAKIIMGYIDIEKTGNIVYVKVGQEDES